MAKVTRVTGVSPTVKESMFRQVGATWPKFKEVFPCFFYANPADVVVQVQVFGKDYATAEIRVITPLKDTEYAVDQALAQEGVMEHLFEMGVSDNAPFMVNLATCTEITVTSFFSVCPPAADGSFLLYSLTDDNIYIVANSVSKAIFATANYMADEIPLSTEIKPTPVGKEVMLALCSAHLGVTIKLGELDTLKIVELPRSSGYTSVRSYSEESLSALKKLGEKTKRKLKKKVDIRTEISLLSIFQRDMGLPNGLIENSRTNPEAIYPFKVDTFLDIYDSMYLQNGAMHIKLIDRKSVEAYSITSTIFKQLKVQFD